MMNDMEVPHEARFVANTVKPVIREVVKKKEKHPGPPCIQGKFVRREVVKKHVKKADRKTEKCPPENASKSQGDICPGIPFFVRVRISPGVEPRFKRYEK